MLKTPKMLFSYPPLQKKRKEEATSCVPNLKKLATCYINLLAVL